MDQKVLFVCGMLFPVVYIIMTILGGALRPGYSHISDTVSELLSPGAPNKPLLVVFQVTHALLGSAFGVGIWQFVRASEHDTLTGRVGAGMIIAVGVATIATAIFPQDAAGAPRTVAGVLHGIFVFGVLVPFTIVSTLLVGIWLRQAGVFPWFRTYSFITIAASILLAGLAGATLDTPMMGLTERLGVLAGFQWTFVLALKLLLL
jgi:uncharacterized protein DUF998